MVSTLQEGFRFGDWTAYPSRHVLLGPCGEVHIEPKVMQLLERLANEPGQVIERDELLEAIWDGRAITDEPLSRCVFLLRRALGDSARNPRYIETIPKRGFRLICDVEPLSGEKLEDDAGPRETITGGKGRHSAGHRPILLYATLGLLIAAAVGIAYRLTSVGPAGAPEIAVEGARITAAPFRSVAVLPFDNMSADPQQEYFSDGISEEILNRLAQIDSLKVIARHSSFSFKGKDVDIATMAEQMSVRHILEGSVRRNGDRVRITAQLIDATDSSQLWSEAYDRDFSAENLIEIQSEIARAITGRLRMTLTGADEERLTKVPTENAEAYAAYLLGRERLKNRKVAELADAVERFSLAIGLDPQFAGAYAGLADACGLYASYSGGRLNELCPPTLAGREQLARKALELDSESAEAWISLGTSITELAERMHETEPQPIIHDKLNEAIAAFERGLELNPTLSEGYHGYGYNLMWIQAYPDPPFGWIRAWQAGRWEAVFDKGLEVDPLSIPLHNKKSWYPVTVSSEEEAKWHGHRMVEIAPESPRGYETVGNQEWELNGRIDESIPWMTKAMEIDPQRPEFPMFIGLAYSALGDPDMALAYFDLAKALTAPDNEPAQKRLLVEQAVVRLLAGTTDTHQVAELLPPSSQTTRKSHAAADSMRLGVFVDLATGRPADALARMEVFSPECIGAIEIQTQFGDPCPDELVRAYRELGDHKAAQTLTDANLRSFQLVVAEYPVTWVKLGYAGTLATAGRTDEALDVLENLVSSGWRGDTYYKQLGFILCCDVRFDAIRDLERFRAIAATIETDMAQQLQNVRAMQRRGEIPTLEEVNALIASRHRPMAVPKRPGQFVQRIVVSDQAASAADGS